MPPRAGCNAGLGSSRRPRARPPARPGHASDGRAQEHEQLCTRPAGGSARSAGTSHRAHRCGSRPVRAARPRSAAAVSRETRTHVTRQIAWIRVPTPWPEERRKASGLGAEDGRHAVRGLPKQRVGAGVRARAGSAPTRRTNAYAENQEARRCSEVVADNLGGSRPRSLGRIRATGTAKATPSSEAGREERHDS